jgi:hypothetical protein
MRNTPVIPLLALGGALALWYWSRTQQGGLAVSQAFDQALRAARAAEEGAEEAVTTGVQYMSNLLPRGIRNNNPGNIDRRIGVNWQGMSPDQSTDSRFIVFSAPEWGIRAIARVLNTYAGRGLNTIEKVISTWAPPKENNTAAYIAAVSSATGIPPNVTIGPQHIPAIIAAIIRHENGVQPYPPETIAKGIELERTA